MWEHRGSRDSVHVRDAVWCISLALASIRDQLEQKETSSNRAERERPEMVIGT